MRFPRLLAVLLFWFLGVTQVWAAESVLTPVQAAYFSAEVRRADETFIQRVAGITASPVDTVRRAMPPEGRIADPATRVIAVLEASRNLRFSDEIKTQVALAETDRRRAIVAAREQAQLKK